MSNKVIKVLLAVFAILSILASFQFYEKNNALKEIKNKLSASNDSIQMLLQDYKKLEYEYEVLHEDLEASKDKLIYVQSKLDTITSRRIQTFTEIQTRLIELKLSLGKIETLQNDSTKFRFK